MTMTRNDSDPGNQHSRWCDGCEQYHGTLYVCEFYPPHVQSALRVAGDVWRRNLVDPAWQQKQLDRGVPPEAIVIYQALAGQ